MKETLYEILGMKAKNSIFKSVVVTDKKTSEGFQIVEIEPYDQTFLNATSSVNKYDNATDRIFKKIYDLLGKDVWVIIDTDQFGHSEHLLSEYNMKQYGLI